MDVTLEDIKVMCEFADGGGAGAKAAFDRLEAKLPSLRGRKFYGAYYLQREEYRAGVTLEPRENPSAYGFETWVIPGGLYVREKMKDWTTRVADIGKTFATLAERERSRVDHDRPSIEFYRNQEELILLLPVRPVAGHDGDVTFYGV